MLPLPNRVLQTFILNEGLRAHEAELGVFGMENPLESCSIGDDGVIIDTPKQNDKKVIKNLQRTERKS